MPKQTKIIWKNGYPVKVSPLTKDELAAVNARSKAIQAAYAIFNDRPEPEAVITSGAPYQDRLNRALARRGSQEYKK